VPDRPCCNLPVAIDNQTTEHRCKCRAVNWVTPRRSIVPG
jgi:hypothetical protein